jgi:tetratricopeptide (TPR) repeat protein
MRIFDMTSTTTPVILLAFANDADDPLRELAVEQDEISQALFQAQRDGKCQVVSLAAATPQKIIEAFQSYHNRICVFHYGGHANSQALFLRKDFPAQDKPQAALLAEFLSTQKGLELVFINGCLSIGQAEAYCQAGAKAVLATDQAIGDEAARAFASLFYRSLANGATISSAFLEAEAGYRLKHGDIPRGIELDGKAGYAAVPWQLFPDKAHQWKLPLVAKYLNPIPAFINLTAEFFGREAELDKLKHKIDHSLGPVLINGMGGIGKTILATAYVQRYRDEYDHLAWISRGEDIIAAVALDESLAGNLGLNFEEDEPLDKRFARISLKMNQLLGRNLLVIDNAQEELAWDQYYAHLPGQPFWKVLITSRLAMEGFERLDLSPLKADAAKMLFRAHFHHPHSEAELEELLEEIGYHPLSIELFSRLLGKSASYLSISQLLEIIRQKKLENAGLQEMVWTRHSKAERPVYAQLLAAFNLTKLNAWEAWLLKQLSVLPPKPFGLKFMEAALRSGLEFRLLKEKFLRAGFRGMLPLAFMRIAAYFFSDMAALVFINKLRSNAQHDQFATYSALNAHLQSLAAKGWLAVNDNAAFSMHPIIQQVIQYHYKIGYPDLELLCASISNRLQRHESLNPVEANFPWIPYGEALTNFLSQTKGLMIWLLRANLAGNYNYLREYEKAKKLLEKNLELNPSSHSDAGSLGMAYLNLGEFDKALNLIEKEYKQRLRKYGPKHFLTAFPQSNLAMVYHGLEDYPKARELQEGALNLLLTRHDIDPQLVLSFKSKLAIIYHDSGLFEQARELHQEVLEKKRSTHIQGHPNLAYSQVNLALTLKQLGQYEKAMELLNDALDILQKNYGANHPDVAMLASHLETTNPNSYRPNQPQG